MSADPTWEGLEQILSQVHGGKRTMTTEGFPRRARMDLWTPAERAIHDAMQAVEALPADERLTRAVILLGEAQGCVADYVDNREP